MVKENINTKKEQKSFKNFSNLFKNTFRIGKMLLSEMPHLFLGMIFFTVVIGVIPVFASKAMGQLIDKIIEATKINSINVVYPTLALFAILTALPSIIRTFLRFIDRHMYLRMQDYFEITALKKRGSFDIAQYEDSKFQDKLQRAFNNGIYPIVNLVDTQISNLEVMVGIIAGSIAAASIDWRVFVLVVITSLPDFWVEIKYGGKIWGIWAENSTEQRRYQDLRRFFQSRYSIIDGKLNQVQEKFLAQIKKILEKFTNDQLSTENWKTGMKIVTSSISVIGLFIGTFIIIRESISGAIAIGTVVFMFQTLNRVSGWTSNMLAYTARLLERNLYVTDIFSVFDEKPIMSQPKYPTKVDMSISPIIKFEKVSFKYPGQSNWALRNINLQISGGQKLGLVGNNGSGKSTLVRLLLRIHDPVEGRITINGVDLRDLNTEDWWNYIGILMQDFTSYDFKIKEAIAISEKNKIDQNKVFDSAKRSTSHDFIEELEKQYDHQLGVEFGGIEPSKGQRQKLAIARALYKTKKILILDEPTASIDAESASIIFREIENIPKDISAILISHNFSTIKKADTIVVLDGGKIIEKGNHQELLNLNGIYAGAYIMQKKEFD